MLPTPYGHYIFVYINLLSSSSLESVFLCPYWQLYPIRIPDLSAGCPVFVSGRYSGCFPESVKVSGILADLSSFVIDVKAQKAKDIPLDRVILKI